LAEYQELIMGRLSEWPYPIRYGVETEVTADVLVIGGGIAGCQAAVNAAKRGVKVAIVDKSAIVRSGTAGTGIDHWGMPCTNPDCKISPDEMMESGGQVDAGDYAFDHCSYICCNESWDALLDLEQMGLQFRDVDDEFAGAPFRGEKTGALFAFDYVNCHTVRLREGYKLKPVLHEECKRLGVELYEHIMVTRLLTEGGRQGARVTGATGVNNRTGEFYLFKAKAFIMATAGCTGLWMFSTELAGTSGEHADPNCTGDGHAMAWQAGAEFTLMERSYRVSGSFRPPAYGAGNAHNTWFPCTIVDANGKEVPWIDRDGRVLKTVEERTRPALGQKFFQHHGPQSPYDIRGPFLIPDLDERIAKGEYVLPLYADLPSMPEHERRAIFGLMVGTEGKTRIPVYGACTRAGFDPDKDMLQANVMPPDGYQTGDWWQAWRMGPRQWRGGGGRFVVDWDLRSNLEGLYAAGSLVVGGGTAGAATTGRYAGRKAADYARTATEAAIDRKQVDEEKYRVYAAVNRKGDIGWKELWAGVCRIMQDYCGETRNEETLEIGLWWLNSIRESEAARTYVRNPHELVRFLQILSRITVGEMVMYASLVRRASSDQLNFKRLDYPQVDPPEWDKFVTIRLENNEVKEGAMPWKYWLKPPYAPTLKENYQQYCGL